METLDTRTSHTESSHHATHSQASVSPARPPTESDPNAASTRPYQGSLNDAEKDGRPGNNDDDDDDDHESSTQLYGFWAPEIAKQRKAYLIGILRSSVLITLLIWGVLAIYWGSLWKATTKTHQLEAWIINRDTGTNTLFGDAVTSTLLQEVESDAPMHLNWQVINPADYPTAQDVEHAVAVDEKAWIAVEIVEDLTDRLFAARASGNASWSPQGHVNLYYSEARANTAVPGYVLSPTQRALQTALGQTAAQAAAQYLTQIAGNATALQALSAAPQTIANPVAATPVNLRPYSQPVATAPTFVGLIYIVIISLNVTLANFNFRQGIQHKLKLRSLIAMRFVVPLLVYFFLSMNYSALSLPFRLAYNGWGLGYGAGFMTFFAATWVGMIVLGLCVECAISIVGPQFIGFFLILLIIANVSVVVLPIPLQPHFYRYGYAMPFYHLRSIYNTIIFNTGRHILVLFHFGVLWLWLLIIFLTFPIWIWLERKRNAPKAAAKKEH